MQPRCRSHRARSPQMRRGEMPPGTAAIRRASSEPIPVRWRFEGLQAGVGVSGNKGHERDTLPMRGLRHKGIHRSQEVRRGVVRIPPCRVFVKFVNQEL